MTDLEGEPLGGSRGWGVDFVVCAINRHQTTRPVVIFEPVIEIYLIVYCIQIIISKKMVKICEEVCENNVYLFISTMITHIYTFIRDGDLFSVFNLTGCES